MTIKPGHLIRKAQCCCGALSVECRGEPASVSMCHCSECQKRTGSAYGIAAFFKEDQVVCSGEYTVYNRPSDSGAGIDFGFCPTCGSTVLWWPRIKPGMVAIAAGSFADPDFPAPGKEVYTENRFHWLDPL